MRSTRAMAIADAPALALDWEERKALKAQEKAEREALRRVADEGAERDGYAYFVVARRLSRVKIGKANDPEQRLRDLQVGSPDELSLVATMPGGLKAEGALHLRFREDRLHGEWFDLTPRIADEIGQLGGLLPWNLGVPDQREARAADIARRADIVYEGDILDLHRLTELLSDVAKADKHGAAPRWGIRDLQHTLEELAAAALGWANSLDDSYGLAGLPAEAS